MASISKIGKSWRVRVRLKNLYRNGTFKTKREAEAWAAATEAAIHAKKLTGVVREEAPTLHAALDRYVREITVHKKSQRTEKIYAKKLAAALGNRKLDEIRGRDVAKYRDLRLKQSSANMVRLELALLSHLYTIAIKEWGFDSLVNPVSQIRKPTPPKGRTRRPTEEEIQYLLNTTQSDSLKTIIPFVLETASRRGEVANLTWEDVDFVRETVLLRETKNGEDRRIALSPEAKALLEQVHRKNSKGSVWSMTADAITRAFNRARDRARKAYLAECEKLNKHPEKTFLVNLHFHDLRHEATTRFFENGLTTEKVQIMTGHKTYSMLKRYTHLKAEDLVKDLKAISAKKQGIISGGMQDPDLQEMKEKLKIDILQKALIHDLKNNEEGRPIQSPTLTQNQGTPIIRRYHVS